MPIDNNRCKLPQQSDCSSRLQSAFGRHPNKFSEHPTVLQRRLTTEGCSTGCHNVTASQSNRQISGWISNFCARFRRANIDNTVVVTLSPRCHGVELAGVLPLLLPHRRGDDGTLFPSRCRCRPRDSRLSWNMSSAVRHRNRHATPRDR